MDHNTILAALMLRNRDSGTSGLPEGSSPNQYLVTDGEGNAKWEDKLAWSEKEVILEEQTINLNKDAYTVTEADNIVVGESYVVGYQGKQYNCVARAISMDGFACPVLGNSFVLADDEVDSGEPFVYLEIPKEVAAQLGFSGYFMTSDGFPDSIIASIHKETIHPIDKKYLPSGNTIFFVQSSTSGQGDTFLYRTEDGANNDDEAERVTKSELEAAFFAGAISVKDLNIEWYFMPVYVRFDRDWGVMLINDTFECNTAEKANAGPV